MVKRVLVAAIGTALTLAMFAAPAVAGPTSLTLTASVANQQCQGGDFVNVTLTATAQSSSQVRGYRWDFTNNGSWDTGVLTDPTVVHRYPDEVTITAKVGARNTEGDRATDTVTFGTLRCG